MNAVAKTDNAQIMEQVIIKGDLSKLTPEERTKYYMKVCESIGLNPLTKPFEYIALNGKLQLYALKACTEQLRGIHDVSVTDLTETLVNDVFIVTAKVRNGDGRTDAAKGAVPIKGLTGEALANAMMKAETKAKRRATLSLCGLGWLDESEIESIPGAKVVPNGGETNVGAEPSTGPTGDNRAPQNERSSADDIEWAKTVFGQVIGLVSAAKSNEEIDTALKANASGLKDLARIAKVNYDTLKDVVTRKRADFAKNPVNAEFDDDPSFINSQEP
jgi:hypothetical protein